MTLFLVFLEFVNKCYVIHCIVILYTSCTCIGATSSPSPVVTATTSTKPIAHPKLAEAIHTNADIAGQSIEA